MILLNYPKQEKVIKHNINECMSKVVEYTFKFNKSVPLE